MGSVGTNTTISAAVSITNPPTVTMSTKERVFRTPQEQYDEAKERVAEFQKEADKIQFTESGSTMKDIESMERLSEMMDNATTGMEFSVSSPYGATTFTKKSDGTWGRSDSGLYAEGGSFTPSQGLSTETVMERISTDLSRGKNKKFKISDWNMTYLKEQFPHSIK